MYPHASEYKSRTGIQFSLNVHLKSARITPLVHSAQDDLPQTGEHELQRVGKGPTLHLLQVCSRQSSAVRGC